MMNTAQHVRTNARSSFTEALQTYRAQTSKSQADISRDAWIDEGYLSKLLSGEKDNPSRDALIRLATFGLDLPVEGVDDLLLAAGYAPLVSPRSLN
jgi:transcriptional regulator with XRE-family HTH domain